MGDLDIFLESIVFYTNLGETQSRLQEPNAIELVADQISMATDSVARELFDRIVSELVQPGVDGCIKDVNKALKHKEAGNIAFAASQYWSAVREYSQALRFLSPHAPEHAHAAATVFCNRALCMSKLGNHKTVIIDCNDAILCNGPSAKANFRRAKAHLALGNVAAAREDALKALDRLTESGENPEQIEALIRELENTTSKLGDTATEGLDLGEEAQQGLNWNTRSVPWQVLLHSQVDPPPLTTGREEALAITGCDIEELNQLVREVALENVAVRPDPYGGRELVVEETVSPGSDVFQEEPLVQALTKQSRLTRCLHCCKSLEEEGALFWPCNGCAMVLFCSPECRESEKYHYSGGPECGVPWTALWSTEIVCALRLARALQRTPTGLRSKAIASLPTHFSKLEPEDAVHYAAVALAARASWNRAVESSGNAASEPTLTVADVLRALSLVRTNGVSIVLEAHQSKEDSIALGMYPCASFMNHSCIPNVSLRFEGNKMIARIPSMLSPTSLRHCYGPQTGEMNVNQRRRILKEQYCFECTCPSCSSPDISDFEMVGLKCPSPGCLGAVPVPHAAAAGLASKYDLPIENNSEGRCTVCGDTLSAPLWEAALKPRLEKALENYKRGSHLYLESIKSSQVENSEAMLPRKKEKSIQEQAQQAVRLLSESLQEREALLHPNNQVLGATNHMLSLASDAASDEEGSIRHLRACLGVARKNYYPNSTNVAFLQKELSLCLRRVVAARKRGKEALVEAASLQTAALNTLERHYGSEYIARLYDITKQR